MVLMVGVFCSAALGDDWDSFDGDDSGGSSVDVGVDVGGSEAGSSDVSHGGAWKYTLDFYIALGVGAVGVLVVFVFLYFFLRKPKNRWKKGS